MNKNESFDNFLVGRLYDTKAVEFDMPICQEDPSNLEELNTEEAYSILRRFGYELGSECQIVKRLLLGEKGLYRNCYHYGIYLLSQY